MTRYIALLPVLSFALMAHATAVNGHYSIALLWVASAAATWPTQKSFWSEPHDF